MEKREFIVSEGTFVLVSATLRNYIPRGVTTTIRIIVYNFTYITYTRYMYTWVNFLF